MRKLRPDEYPTVCLPKLGTKVPTATPGRPLVRRLLQENEDKESGDSDRIEEPPT